jgi:hypothetical protein
MTKIVAEPIRKRCDPIKFETTPPDTVLPSSMRSIMIAATYTRHYDLRSAIRLQVNSRNLCFNLVLRSQGCPAQQKKALPIGNAFLNSGLIDLVQLLAQLAED